MALFQSGNPTLSEKAFDRSMGMSDGSVMTFQGSINKFGFLMLMVIAGAAYSWHLYSSFQTQTMAIVMGVGFIGGLITALVMIFRPKTARYLAPAYGLFQGFVLGSISALINDKFQAKYPGIAIQAVGLTMGVALSMFLLYKFRIIRATQRLRSIVISSIMGIALFYLIAFVLQLCNVSLPFMHNGSPLGIGISLFVIAIAALKLILDFDMIEQGANRGAPSYMEWYGAFALLVTIIWLYMEILKLLTRIASNRD